MTRASERAEHDALVGLVERIPATQRAAPSTDTSALWRDIDQRVYLLYALTPSEISQLSPSHPSHSSCTVEEVSIIHHGGWPLP